MRRASECVVTKRSPARVVLRDEARVRRGRDRARQQARGRRLERRALGRADGRVGRQGGAEAVGGPDDEERQGAHRDEGGGERRRGTEEAEEQEHRHEDGGGELRGEGGAGGEAGGDDAAGCRLLDDTRERHDREEEEEREGEVGGDEGAVGEDVGRQRGEAERRRGRGVAEPAPRLQEDGDDEARGEGHDRQPPEEEQAVGVVPAVQEAPPELPLAGFHPGPGVGLQHRPHREERRRGQELRERRLLRVQAVVAEGEVGVARRQVSALVEGGRAPAHRVNGEAGLEGHGGGHERDGRAPAHGRGAPAAGRGTTSSTACAIARAAIRWAISFGCSSSAPFTTSSAPSSPR